MEVVRSRTYIYQSFSVESLRNDFLFVALLSQIPSGYNPFIMPCQVLQLFKKGIKYFSNKRLHRMLENHSLWKCDDRKDLLRGQARHIIILARRWTDIHCIRFEMFTGVSVGVVNLFGFLLAC